MQSSELSGNARMIGSSEAMFLQFFINGWGKIHQKILVLLGGKHLFNLFHVDFRREAMMLTPPMHLNGHISLFVIGAKDMSIEGLTSWGSSFYSMNFLINLTCDEMDLFWFILCWDLRHSRDIAICNTELEILDGSWHNGLPRDREKTGVFSY